MARELLLDIALLAAGDLDPSDNLILLGVSQANVRLIVARPEAQQRYAHAAANPPDELRRPISIAALSRALGLPLETVRRRAQRLCGLGRLAATERGLVVPGERMETPHHLEAIHRLDPILRRALTALAETGLFEAGELPRAGAQVVAPPVRAVGRLVGDYYLRMLAPLRACCGDPMDAVILLVLLRRNEPPAEGQMGAISPVRPSRIARDLGSSAETVRRRLGRLVDAGLCRRTATGYVVPRRVLEETVLPRMSGPCRMNLRRLFRQLTAVWGADAGQDVACETPPPGP